ncbi:MAG: pyridoxamine 5'-phosphate oxidase [Paraburkholderia sp.]|uniref:pyridoxamine 5'-phosphate oxidase n=1 Tax=Paraburkholderia sp. TaxID=1926495 RepID=UPI00122461AC|nr:pyridoxamine 5'-phosphate oxidase [Paraburkholderia sp.]TAM03831.1 MAG: pyridoxamine 5'-phosphate oxidase [Paraburkholderia sp.]TAM31776.1 MAG: pyridoxamine 5'-phosphate oxidase [Paraburkholderia sp.]
MTTLADLRKTYSLGSLDAADVDPDPIRQFQTWLAQALDAKLPEPNTMTVATVDAEGRPSARILLIKGVDERGFVFYTNYESRKGHDLIANPHACLLFYWIELERQVRIDGKVEKTTDAESDEYFHSRPLGSRIGAWASQQSAVIGSRAELEAREREFAAKFGENPPRPPHWGGFRLVPDTVEFWQGRPSRLHDRIRYSRESEGAAWRIERLAP